MKLLFDFAYNQICKLHLSYPNTFSSICYAYFRFGWPFQEKQNANRIALYAAWILKPSFNIERTGPSAKKNCLPLWVMLQHHNNNDKL